MKRVAVTSTSIVSVGHDPATDILEIEFPGGRIYQYVGVKAEDVAALIKAPSIGKHFSQHIRNGFKAVKVA
jgi:hypothetical protein